MKYLVYQIEGHTSVYDPETEKVQEVPLLAKVEMPWSEANEEIAKAEAYNGEYSIEDDGEPEAPTTDAERITELEEALALLLSGVTE